MTKSTERFSERIKYNDRRLVKTIFQISQKYFKTLSTDEIEISQIVLFKPFKFFCLKVAKYNVAQPFYINPCGRFGLKAATKRQAGNAIIKSSERKISLFACFF